MANFAPSTWQAFRAFMFQGRKVAAVAAELSISEMAVGTTKSYILKRLRQVAKEPEQRYQTRTKVAQALSDTQRGHSRMASN